MGPDSGTCRARFEALIRLGHAPRLVDPFAALRNVGLARTWSFKTGGWGLDGLVERYVCSQIAGETFDLAYVDGGELVSPQLVRRLRRSSSRVVNYNPDNPYRRRDGWRWRLFHRALAEYDLVVVPRQENVLEAQAFGVKAVLRVWFAADDPLKDERRLPSEEARAPYRSAVSFVGTWMPERGRFLRQLIEQGTPLRIFGPRWDRAPEFGVLAAHTTLGFLDTADYDAAVAAADVSIGLLSRGNRDEHTTRSLEIPTLGSLLCGERTSEHLQLYQEGREAVFWSSAEECAEACRLLLANPVRRRRIAAAGRRRALVNNCFNEPLMQTILTEAMEPARLRLYVGQQILGSPISARAGRKRLSG